MPKRNARGNKVAKLYGRSVKIDTVALKKELLGFKEAAQNSAADLTAQSLKAMISAINYQASARRERAKPYFKNTMLSSGTRDEPLLNATVNVRSNKGRVYIYVTHRGAGGRNIFNILDGGSGEKELSKRIFFPAYIGQLIPDGQTRLGDPELVLGLLGSVEIPVIDPDTGQAVLVVKPAGSVLSGYEGKNLYRQAADWVLEQLLEQGIVNKSRRSKYRLKLADVKVSINRIRV